METHNMAETQSTGRVLAILAFHKIGEPPPNGWETWNYVPGATFAAYLKVLRDNGWQVIDHRAFLRGLVEPDSLPERSAMLTFDDGYRSILEEALSWLRRFGYPAMVFVPTHFIGGWNAFDADVEPEEAICDWDDLQELERCGVSVQAHGAWHRPFSELDAEEIAKELAHSKTVLEAGLGKPIEVFAYPYGDSGVDPMRSNELLRQAGFRAACLYGGGPIALPIVDRYRLARLAMGPDTNLQIALDRACAESKRG
jgi:peptidoglycan/xylan/chitin deacetylase (PgdA/CDA1 family)